MTSRPDFGSNEAIFRGDETILKRKTFRLSGLLLKDDPMFEFIVAVIALSSVSIFFAHAVEAYFTQ
jgi:hypothetical protein